MSAPGIASTLANLASTAAGKVGSVVGAVNDSGQYGSDDQAVIPLAPDATGQQATDAIQELKPSNEKANVGIEKAAQYQQNVLTPIAKESKESGLTQQQLGNDVSQNSVDEFRNAVNETHQKTYDVENAIKTADEAASIDPNGPNGYLGRMGVGQKTLTAIGILLSGAGAGLTGRPNMAYDMLQKNIDRDIQNQKDIFQQKMEVVAKQKGLLQSAQDRQQLAQNALNAATIVVTTGINNALNGAQAQVVGGTSNDLANVTKNTNNQKYGQALGNFNQNYIKTIKSGNTKQVKMLGIAADVVNEAMGRGPIGLNKRPLDQAQNMDPTNAMLNSGSTQRIPEDNLSKIVQQESAMRNKEAGTSPRGSFLDALSKIKTGN